MHGRLYFYFSSYSINAPSLHLSVRCLASALCRIIARTALAEEDRLEGGARFES